MTKSEIQRLLEQIRKGRLSTEEAAAIFFRLFDEYKEEARSSYENSNAQAPRACSISENKKKAPDFLIVLIALIKEAFQYFHNNRQHVDARATRHVSPNGQNYIFARNKIHASRIAPTILKNAELRGNYIRACSIINMVLSDSNVLRNRLNGCSLSMLELNGSSWRETHLTGVHFRNVRVDGADIIRSRMTGVRLVDSNLINGTSWIGIEASGLNIEKAVIDNSHWRKCAFDKTKIFNTQIERVTIKNCAFENVQFHNCKLRDLVLADLRLENRIFKDQLICDELRL